MVGEVSHADQWPKDFRPKDSSRTIRVGEVCHAHQTCRRSVMLTKRPKDSARKVLVGEVSHAHQVLRTIQQEGTPIFVIAFIKTPESSAKEEEYHPDTCLKYRYLC